MRENLKLFKTEHFEVPVPDIKKKAKKFILGYKSIESFLEMEVDSNKLETLQFYSSLYEVMNPLLTEIHNYVITDIYASRRKCFEDAISRSQTILGLIRILHLRYQSITSIDPIEDFNWYKLQKKSNSEIIGEIATLFAEMYPKKNKGWVFLILFLK